MPPRRSADAPARGAAAPGQGANRPARSAAGRPTPARSPGAPPARVRIVGGDWKRTPLSVARVPGLRPTPDRVRETLFNWLGARLDGWRCVDAFAGTGALAFEAASRGAAEVVAIERHPLAVAALREAAERLAADRVRIVPGDAPRELARLAAAGAAFDAVFLDPPFGQGWIERAAPAAAALLAPGGFLYLEAERAPDAALLEALAGQGVAPWRADRAGQVHYHLLRRAAAHEEPA